MSSNIVLSNRSKCVICSGELSEIFCLKNMPVYMGHNIGKEEIFSDMTFLKCESCGTVQIKEILNPDLVYMTNHNKSIIGNIWKNHFEKLTEFIKPYIENKKILEVGDPSFKVSSSLSNSSEKWFIVEPNFDDIDIPENVILIKGFFTKETNINDNVDVIFHSHLMEHLVNPSEDLSLFYDKLNDNGKLIFSVPNFEHLLESGRPVNSILHFEHTYYFNFKSMSSLLSNNGFYVENYYYYENHSIFFVCSKQKINKSLYRLKDIDIKFSNLLNKYKNWVEDVNDKIKKYDKVYLYGCHVSSQFIINLGLSTNKIFSILDNDNIKNNHVLYGTKLVTYSPETISKDSSPVVVINHMGVYSEEIKNQLKKINENVIFL
jgi:predicted SAM-dependent methyltransferase